MRHVALASVLLCSLAGCDDAGGTGDDAGAARDAAGLDAAGSDAAAQDAAAQDASAADGGGADASVPSGPVVDRSDPRLYDHALDPVELDPTVADSLELQFALLDTRAEPLGKLVFFLPGANNRPADWRAHGRLLASLGFHVVIPHYDNRWGSACSGMGGSCNVDTRWEALTGEPVSSVIDVSRADSAEGRVLVMLAHLAAAHPGGDWGYYLDAVGALRDEHVIIAGISHGATSAGLFGARRAFHRVVMHSGGFGGVGATPATPIAEFYGLSHTDDEQHTGHLASWASAGMLGAPTSVDDAAPPYGGARQLITSIANSYPHCSVAVHGSSPRDAGGDFLFAPAWRALYGVAP